MGYTGRKWEEHVLRSGNSMLRMQRAGCLGFGKRLDIQLHPVGCSAALEQGSRAGGLATKGPELCP